MTRVEEDEGKTGKSPKIGWIRFPEDTLEGVGSRLIIFFDEFLMGSARFHAPLPLSFWTNSDSRRRRALRTCHHTPHTRTHKRTNTRRKQEKTKRKPATQMNQPSPLFPSKARSEKRKGKKKKKKKKRVNKDNRRRKIIRKKAQDNKKRARILRRLEMPPPPLQN